VETVPAWVRFIDRYKIILFYLLIGGAFAGFFLIESVFNGGFYETVSAVWLPLALMIAYVLWFYRPRSLGLWLLGAMLYPVMLLMIWPHAMILNALLPKQGELVYEGPIVHKWISQGRSRGYQLVLLDEATRERVTLTVSERAYERFSERDRARSTFTLGGFGIPYRWRFDDGGSEE